MELAAPYRVNFCYILLPKTQLLSKDKNLKQLLNNTQINVTRFAEVCGVNTYTCFKIYFKLWMINGCNIV